MAKKMLIDALHLEESRMTIIENNKLEEFDFETSTKKQLKGNIYLAKVVRIEPSLQAAFVEFGGNRHGFLAFNEIHPDYYRIPVEDREALLAEVAKRAEEELEDLSADDAEKVETVEQVEILGGEDVEEIQARPKRVHPSRQYKIQEVVKRHQIMLVQVVKEERGGKGAALTTYLSLAGRYCVLMPNAAKGGGVSRKITNAADRKRLRTIIEDIELPETMAVIIRTAGMSRSKTEIKRDCDYLVRLWNLTRDKTLNSVAPSLIYEEGGLIKRSIRDYYNRDIDEIIVAGEDGYKEARDFMRQLMPSHAKKVKQYDENHHPLFHKHGIEKQIDSIHNPVVQLKSGGYIVFGTTEALVAIDVNSGRATRERHIEETAFRTNMEAAEEVARQLRLRDLAGLIVIDFIDMDEPKNVEAIERHLKDAMRHDRARVQVGRISLFGLLELSRQRLRPNIMEATSIPCHICRGSGMVRSAESSALHVLRAIEEDAIQKHNSSELVVHVPLSVGLYILNQKREQLKNIEMQWNLKVHVNVVDDLIAPDYRIERTGLKRGHAEVSVNSKLPEKEPQKEQENNSDKERNKRFNRNKFDRKTRSNNTTDKNTVSVEDNKSEANIPTSSDESAPVVSQSTPGVSQSTEDGQPRRNNRRRRMRRGGRRNHFPKNEKEQENTSGEAVSPAQLGNGNEKKNKSEINHKPIEEKPVKNNNKQDAPKKQPRKGWWQRLLE